MLEINFARLRQEEFRDICLALEDALAHLQIDYYLIGAFARDIWFTQENINSRRTSDIDFAILVPERHQFEKLKQFLSSKKGFRDLKNNAFAMLSPTGITVDILPFGSIEIDEDLKQKEAIATTGFREVYERSVQLFQTDEGGIKLKVASLSGIFLLKLIAFEDRPEMRTKDPGDLMDIIENFFDLHTDLIYEQHADIFENELDLKELSCIVIGREIKHIVAGNDPLKRRVIDFLGTQLSKGEQSDLIRLMRQASRSLNTDEIIQCLTQLVANIDAS